MLEFTKETRAKRGYILTPDGKKDHMVVSEGMFNTKEMERVMADVAEDVGADKSDIRVEYYNHGDAPISANPRHRGWLSQKQWGGFGDGVRTSANKPLPKETNE